MMARVQCWLFGHPDSVIAWGPWIDRLRAPRYRVLTEVCIRCRSVVERTTLVEGQPWSA